MVVLGLLSAVVSFGVGIETSGDIETVELTGANETVLESDVNADGLVDIADAIVILEVAHGYRVATPTELSADPNGNGVLTIDDALAVLRSLPR